MAFGAGAESMAASWPHGVADPASSASMPSELNTDSYPIVDLGFLI